MDKYQEQNAKPSYEELAKQVSQLKNKIKVIETVHNKVQEAAMIGSWDWDLISGEVKWSVQMYRMLGYAPNGVSPSNEIAKSHVHKHDVFLYEQSIENALKNKTEFSIENRIVTVNKDLKYVNSIGKVICDKNKVPVRMIGIVHDITEIKRKENELDETSKMAKVGGWQIDFLGNTLSWTSETYRIHELSEGIMPGVADAIQYYHPDDRQMVNECVQNSIEKGENFDFEARLITAKNNLKWVRAYGQIVSKGAENIGIQGMIQDITEFKNNAALIAIEKERAEKSEKRFESLYKNAPLPYHALNEEGYFIEVNPAWLLTLGYKMEDVIGKYYGDFLHPDWKEHFKNKFPKFKEVGHVHTTFKIRHKKGHYLDIDLNGNILTDNKGSFKQTNCVFQDITEQKLAEDALVKNQFYLSKAQEIGKIGTWELDILNNNLYWTRENYINFGVKYWTKLSYEIFLNCIHPDDRDYVNEEWKAAMEGKPYDVEHRVVKEGKVFWLREKADIKFDDNGKAISAIGFSQDITSFKESESKLKESERKFRILADNTTDWEYWLDENNEYVFISKSCELITGYSTEEFHKNPELFMDLVRQDYKEEVSNHYHKEDRTAPLFKTEFPIVIKNNEEIWIEHSCIPIFDEKGKFLGRRGNNRDITEKKISEINLEKAKEQFELAMKASQDGLFDWDLETNEIYYSHGWKKMLGYEEHELPNDFSIWENLTKPEDVKKSWEMQQELIARKRDRFELEFKMKHKKGHWIDVLSKAEAIFNEEEKAVRIVGTHTDITEKNETLLKLKESEAKFRALYDHSPDMYVSVSPDDGIIILCNDTYLSKMGYTRKEIIGESIFKAYHNDSIKDAKEAFKQFQEKGVILNKELILATKTGEKIYVSLNVTTIRDENGKILYSMSSWRDISERIKIREKLRRDRQLLDETGRIAKIGGWEIDVETMTSYYSKETKRIYGIPVDVSPPEGIEGINYYPPGAKDKLQKLVTEALTNGIPYDIEIPFINEQGENLWVRTIGLAEKKDNKVTRLYGTIQDITEDKIVEQELKLNENRLSALVELTQMTDKSEDFIYDFTLNKAIELTQSQIGFLGFVNDDESKVKIYKWSDTAMKECTVEGYMMNFIIAESGIWGDVIRNREPLVINDYKAPIINKKGIPEGHVSITNYLSIPTFSDGKIVAIISVANKNENYNQSDIHQTTLLLDGMRKFLEQLKEKEELIKAKLKAEESDRLKSAFLSNMSHEIRTPMNGIIGFTELLQEADLPLQNQQNYINIIRKSGDRLLNTVNDIIEISKIESGQVKVSKSEVDFIELLENLVASFRPEIENKGLELLMQNEIGGENSFIKSDESKLNSILSNLIKNAIKFTDKGEIKVGFKTSDGELLFTCQDTGIGIPKDRIEAIFNRFEQADIEDKMAHQGSGLGLAISKSYVEMLDGKIWVESEEGKNSVFYVSLPHNKLKENKQLLENQDKVSITSKKNIKILIVEDDEYSSMHLKAVISEITENMIYAENGIEALEICKNQSDIDLVLMDLKMPKMDGYEATRRIREFNKDIVIIAQTAYAFEEDKQNALKAGCTDFISKPIKSDKLLKLLKKYF